MVEFCQVCELPNDCCECGCAGSSPSSPGYPRTRTVKLQNGKVVSVINFLDTPPPDEGFYRCNYCGEQVAIDNDKPYALQSDHEACPTGVKGQSMMGRNWGGWKRG